MHLTFLYLIFQTSMCSGAECWRWVSKEWGRGVETVGEGFGGHISKKLESNAALLVRSGFRRKKTLLSFDSTCFGRKMVYFTLDR